MRMSVVSGLFAGLGLAACSSFNMLPPCDQTLSGLGQAMIANYSKPIDEPRLGAIVSFSPPQEIAAAYNERTCRTDATAFGETLTIVYNVRQSEGVKGWGEYTLPNDSAADSFIARLRAAYAQ